MRPRLAISSSFRVLLGAGKSTVLKRLLKDCPLPLELSVSATTRPPRPGERDGVDYRFLTSEDFIHRQQNGEFLEWKEVYGRGDLYGTLRDTVTAGLETGKWVVLEVDVEGAMMVVEQRPETITTLSSPRQSPGAGKKATGPRHRVGGLDSTSARSRKTRNGHAGSLSTRNHQSDRRSGGSRHLRGS